MLSMKLGLPWVFPTVLFYLASVKVEGVPEACRLKNKGRKKLPDFQLSVLLLWGS